MKFANDVPLLQKFEGTTRPSADAVGDHTPARASPSEREGFQLRKARAVGKTRGDVSPLSCRYPMSASLRSVGRKRAGWRWNSSARFSTNSSPLPSGSLSCQSPRFSCVGFCLFDRLRFRGVVSVPPGVAVTDHFDVDVPIAEVNVADNSAVPVFLLPDDDADGLFVNLLCQGFLR